MFRHVLGAPIVICLKMGAFHHFPVLYMAVGQNLRYLFGVGYPPKVVYFKRLQLGVHRGTVGVLTHSHMFNVPVLPWVY